MSLYSVSAAFTGAPGDRLFVVSHCPLDGARGCVLLVPPFAEEMNKSRRMLALAARGLAARGLVAVLPDLFGTGDSEGEFAEGTWTRWQDNLRDIRAFLENQGCRVTSILAVRTGCVLASEVATRQRWNLARSVFWQPVIDGERFLTQFLRLRVAATLMENDRRETVSELRSRLSAGETLEIAGYAVSPALAAQLANVRLGDALSAQLGALNWIEVVRGEGDSISTAGRALIDGAQQKEFSIDGAIVHGEPFWSSTEIVENPVLVERTVEFLARI